MLLPPEQMVLGWDGSTWSGKASPDAALRIAGVLQCGVAQSRAKNKNDRLRPFTEATSLSFVERGPLCRE